MEDIEYNHQIKIDVVRGGFVLNYPVRVASPTEKFGLPAGVPAYNYTREIFTSSRKMNQRIKEVLEAVSTTSVDAE